MISFLSGDLMPLKLLLCRTLDPEQFRNTSQEDGAVRPLTVEADVADVLEQFLPSCQVHLGADAGVLRTQVPLHVVEGVGHGVHGVHHELNLPLLLVLGIDADTLLT